MLARQATAPSSTQGRSRGGSKSTEAYVRGECGEDGCVPCVGIVPLSWYVSAGVVSSLAISVGSTLSGWVKSSVG